jgi:hypothetical protein
VARQFVDHPLSVDLMFRGMVQDVEPDEAAQQVLELHLGVPLSNFVKTVTWPTLCGYGSTIQQNMMPATVSSWMQGGASMAQSNASVAMLRLRSFS